MDGLKENPRILKGNITYHNLYQFDICYLITSSSAFRYDPDWNENELVNLVL